MKPTTCKFKITSVTRFEGAQEQITASAVCFNPFDHPENKSFSQYTPSGDLKFTVSNPELFDNFKPGAFVYLTLSEAPAA